MDWMRLLLDRLFGFLACLVPGCVILLLLMIHRPDLVSAIWSNQILSYETKWLITIGASFVFGFSAFTAFTAFCGGFGGVIGGWLGPLQDPEIPPWQSKPWRGLLGRYLGPRAPEDLDPIPDELFQKQLEAIAAIPEEGRLQATVATYQGKNAAMLNDLEWKSWWDYFHRGSLIAQTPIAKLYETTNESFYVAALILLMSLPFTPSLRIWWVVLFCIFWVIHFALRVIFVMTKARDPWRTYQDQIDFFQKRLLGEEVVEDSQH